MAEGGGLLNRYRVKSSIGGSNPPLSATLNRFLRFPQGQQIHEFLTNSRTGALPRDVLKSNVR